MTQINLQSPYIKEFVKYLGWILLFVFLWFRGCSGSTPTPQIAKVIIPEVKGTFQAKKPVHEPIPKWSNSTTLKISQSNIDKNDSQNDLMLKNEGLMLLVAENEKLKLDFAKSNDSIKELKYKDAVQLHNFNSKFEDDNLILNINGIVQGEVKEVTPDYTIKEKKMEVPLKQKETVFRLLGGLEVGNTTKLDAFKLKANLMFQNRKGNIISGSFDTGKNVWLGYNVSIFDVKR